MDILLKKKLKQVFKKVLNKVRSLEKVLKKVNLLIKGFKKCNFAETSEFNEKIILFLSFFSLKKWALS